jgi:hypothetical protein
MNSGSLGWLLISANYGARTSLLILLLQQYNYFLHMLPVATAADPMPNS